MFFTSFGSLYSVDVKVSDDVQKTIDDVVGILNQVAVEKAETDKNKDIINLVLKVVPIGLSIGVLALTFMDQLFWEDAVSLLGIAVLALSIKNFCEKSAIPFAIPQMISNTNEDRVIFALIELL